MDGHFRRGRFQISFRELIFIFPAAVMGLGWFFADRPAEKITIRSVDINSGELKLNVPSSLITKVKNLSLKSRPKEQLKIVRVEANGSDAIVTVQNWPARRVDSQPQWAVTESDFLIR